MERRTYRYQGTLSILPAYTGTPWQSRFCTAASWLDTKLAYVQMRLLGARQGGVLDLQPPPRATGVGPSSHVFFCLFSSYATVVKVFPDSFPGVFEIRRLLDPRSEVGHSSFLRWNYVVVWVRTYHFPIFFPSFFWKSDFVSRTRSVGNQYFGVLSLDSPLIWNRTLKRDTYMKCHAYMTCHTYTYEVLRHSHWSPISKRGDVQFQKWTKRRGKRDPLKNNHPEKDKIRGTLVRLLWRAAAVGSPSACRASILHYDKRTDINCVY